MKVDDLVFESASCCGTCVAATVDLSNGEQVGIVRRDDGLFDLSFYGEKGLLRRLLGQTVEQVEAVI